MRSDERGVKRAWWRVDSGKAVMSRVKVQADHDIASHSNHEHVEMEVDAWILMNTGGAHDFCLCEQHLRVDYAGHFHASFFSHHHRHCQQ